MHEQFPCITEVALDMAYANGAINRGRTQEVFLQKVDEVLSAYSFSLTPIEEWVMKLSEEDRSTLADGEEYDIEALEAGAPANAKELFNDIFTKAVC